MGSINIFFLYVVGITYSLLFFNVAFGNQRENLLTTLETVTLQKKKAIDLVKCELVIKTPQGEINVGDEIYLQSKFKNKGSSIVFLPVFNSYEHQAIEIKDVKGNIVSVSEKGRERQSFPEMGSYGLREVAPGDEYQFQITISDLYELPVGKYSVAVLQTFLVKNENEDEKKITHVKSNSIKLVIK